MDTKKFAISVELCVKLTETRELYRTRIKKEIARGQNCDFYFADAWGGVIDALNLIIMCKRVSSELYLKTCISGAISTITNDNACEENDVVKHMYLISIDALEHAQKNVNMYLSNE